MPGPNVAVTPLPRFENKPEAIWFSWQVIRTASNFCLQLHRSKHKKIQLCAFNILYLKIRLSVVPSSRSYQWNIQRACVGPLFCPLCTHMPNPSAVCSFMLLPPLTPTTTKHCLQYGYKARFCSQKQWQRSSPLPLWAQTCCCCLKEPNAFLLPSVSVGPAGQAWVPTVPIKCVL